MDEQKKTGLAAIIGKWPGDETDEEIQAALDMLGKCQKCRKLEDLLRWRKYPEEKPMVSGEYLNLHFYESGEWGIYESYFCDGSENNGEVYWSGRQANYWRPIGPLPGEGGDAK